MPSDLFDSLFVPAGLREAVSDQAWLQAMLDAERALALAEAAVGVIPQEAADAIAAACTADRFDAAEIGAQGRATAAPVEPLVRALRAEVGGEAAGYIHWGPTSQDIVDTAAMLVALRARPLILADVEAVAGVCAELADRHRRTLMAARTLLQHALPTTFGLKAAVWLVGLLDAASELGGVPLYAQLGGAAGTLGSLGDRGTEVVSRYADELGLLDPGLPWHTNRVPAARLAGALDLVAGACAKIALDIALLAQTEVGELAESGDGRGGSSTLPHKRNPVGSVLALACARRTHAAAGLVTGGLAQELERAAGSWQSEWQALSDALAAAGGAAWGVREALEGLSVDEERMRRNLELSGGGVMAEGVSFVLSEHLGRADAKKILKEASRREEPLRAALLADPRVTEHLSAEAIDDALDPAGYLGSADVFVDRALALHRKEIE